jgi:hypothetical protein
MPGKNICIECNEVIGGGGGGGGGGGLVIGSLVIVKGTVSMTYPFASNNFIS